jgi:hypothetical protein
MIRFLNNLDEIALKTAFYGSFFGHFTAITSAASELLIEATSER